MPRDRAEMSDDDLFAGSWDANNQRSPAVLLHYFLEDLSTLQVIRAHLFKVLYAVMVAKSHVLV